MAFHAKISASAMKRVLNCPASVALIETLPKQFIPGSSEPARLGTAAHGLGEHCLVNGLHTADSMLGGFVGLTRDEDAEVHAPDPLDGEDLATKFFYAWVYDIDEDMVEAVNLYLQIVRETVQSLPGCELKVETRFNMDWLRPDLGGTSDATVWQFLGRLVVIDYKHGQGVSVEVEGNEQLLSYALGMAHEVDWLFDEVELVIVQPRCPHEGGAVRRWTCTKADLEAFRDRVAAGVDRVEEARAIHYGTAEHPDKVPTVDIWDYAAAGDHCKWCPVGPICRKWTETVSHLAAMDFEDVPHDLDLPEVAEDGPTDEQLRMLADTMEWVPMIDAWTKGVMGLGTRLAMRGVDIPRHKVVRKRANRVLVADEKEIVRRMTTEAGVAKEKLYKPGELKSAAQLEKLGKEAKQLINGVPNKPKDVEAGAAPWKVAPLARKGEGGLTLAHESDPREAVSVDPSQDFNDVEGFEE